MKFRKLSHAIAAGAAALAFASGAFASAHSAGGEEVAATTKQTGPATKQTGPATSDRTQAARQADRSSSGGASAAPSYTVDPKAIRDADSALWGV